MIETEPKERPTPRAVAGRTCTACEASVGHRRIAEMLLRAGLTIRDAADFSSWYAMRNDERPVLKSAWGRHKINGHMPVLDNHKRDEDKEVQTLQDMVTDMFQRFQANRKDYVPSSQEMRDWMTLEARIADLQQRRQDERDLRALVSGMSYTPPPVAIEARVIQRENKE